MTEKCALVTERSMGDRYQNRSNMKINDFVAKSSDFCQYLSDKNFVRDFFGFSRNHFFGKSAIFNSKSAKFYKGLTTNSKNSISRSSETERASIG